MLGNVFSALDAYQNLTTELRKKNMSTSVRISPLLRQDSDLIGFKWHVSTGILKRLSSNSNCSED